MIDHRERLDKQLLALGRELNELNRRRMIVVELSEPVQHGWIRRYVVADKIGNHKHRAMLQEILDVIGTVARSKTPDFRTRRRRKKKHACVEIQQPLKVISVSRWEQRQYPEEWKQYFRLELVKHRRLWHPTYVFAHRGLFELRVEPNYLTKIHISDPAVERRMAEIHLWLSNRNLMPRLDWLRGIRINRWRSRDTKGQWLSKIHRHEIRETLKRFPEVDPVPAVRRHRISLLTSISPA